MAAGVDGCRGRLGPLFVGRRPTWACAPVMEGRRDHCRGLRAGVARGLKERDDRWARRGSEGERGDARAVSDRWGRRLRRVARGASPDVERASRAERGAERWAERDAARGGTGLVQRSWAEAGAAWEQAGARELGPCGSRKGLG